MLGLGAGWQENEHRAYGLPFYTTAERLARLDEACQIVKSLFANERTTFHGQYYQVDDAPLSPKPVQDPLPLMIGGGGERVTLRIVAKHAHEWNAFGTPEVRGSRCACQGASTLGPLPTMRLQTISSSDSGARRL